MARIEELLNRRRILIADGAWGTELAKRGLGAGDCPEMWNIDHPADVAAVAEAYVQAGAEIILTNTFGASPVKLARFGLQQRTHELNEAGAAISREAADGKALVFASVGPTGEFMEPLGSITLEQMIECFSEQIRGLADGGADAILVETMADLGEAKAALQAARAVAPHLPVAVSMTFSPGPAGFATMMGVKPDQAARELEAAGAAVVGSNCGTGIADTVQVARIMRASTALPLWMKPNAGLPQLVNGKTVFFETPEQFAEQFDALAAAGATVIGGCCGTTPEHIRLLALRRNRM